MYSGEVDQQNSKINEVKTAEAFTASLELARKKLHYTPTIGNAINYQYLMEEDQGHHEDII